MQEAVRTAEEVVWIPVDQILPSPHQTREHFDEEALDELADSIKTPEGLMQPVVLRPHVAGEGRYELIAGERRWRAHKRRDWPEIKAVIKHVSDEEAEDLTLIENIQRQDLTVMERAKHVLSLSNRHGGDKHLIAHRLGKSVSYVAEYLDLFNLPQAVQALLSEGKINLAHAKVLGEMEGEAAQVSAANTAAKLKLTADQLRGRVQRNLKSSNNNGADSAPVKFDQLSATVVKLYEMNEGFDFSMLRDEKKRTTLRNQIGILQESLEKAKGILS